MQLTMFVEIDIGRNTNHILFFNYHKLPQSNITKRFFFASLSEEIMYTNPIGFEMA